MALGVALIGSGIFAREQHLPAILACPDLLRLRGVYSRSLKAADSLTSTAIGDDSLTLSGVSTYGDDAGKGRDFTDLLVREDVNCVVIALPIAVQPEYVRKALEAGKHVLSEKPIAMSVDIAQTLLEQYRRLQNEQNGETCPTWCVAENFRFLQSFVYAAKRVHDLGRVLGFSVRMSTMVKQGDRYLETSWRKVPSYQGGFLLDGGVHFTAGLRFLLDSTSSHKPIRIERLSAYTAQLQPHLPPVDTVDAVMKTTSGVAGSFSLSFGTTLPDNFQYDVACEAGSVTVKAGEVIVQMQGQEGSETTSFPDEGEGVVEEVRAWASSLQDGKMIKSDNRQDPYQALADLELLEAMLRSGESAGKPVDMRLQVIHS